MKCAVYQAIGSYESGLLFVALPDEAKWLKLKRDYAKPIIHMSMPDDYQFKRLGEMEVDASVIPFQTERDITFADFTDSG